MVGVKDLHDIADVCRLPLWLRTSATTRQIVLASIIILGRARGSVFREAFVDYLVDDFREGGARLLPKFYPRGKRHMRCLPDP